MHSTVPDFIKNNFRSKMEELYSKADSIFVGWKFQRPVLAFDLRGRTAGMFTHRYDKECKLFGIQKLLPTIRLHEEFVLYEYEDMLNDTLPHEIAHHIVWEVFEQGKRSSQRAKSHGVEWAAIATVLGAKPMARCHNYSLARCPRTNKIRPLAALLAEQQETSK